MDKLQTIAEQFELLAANVAELRTYHDDDCQALARLDAAYVAVERGLALVRSQIEKTRETRPPL